MELRDQDVRFLIDKDAIRELVLSYCQACDRGDVALMRSLYLPDALDEHGMNASGTAREFIDGIAGMQVGLNMLQHNVTNHSIRMDGDLAEGEVYIVAYHNFMAETGPTMLVSGGRYLDRYTRHDGAWMFAHRRCVSDWTYQAPIPSLQPQLSLVETPLPVGRIGEADPAYAFFTLFRRGQRTA